MNRADVPKSVWTSTYHHFKYIHVNVPKWIDCGRGYGWDSPDDWMLAEQHAWLAFMADLEFPNDLCECFKYNHVPGRGYVKTDTWRPPAK